VIEVVDSPAESLKYVTTQIGQEPEAPAQNRKNRTLRFGKPDYPLLSILTIVANRTIQFCQFRRQSGAPPPLDGGASPPAK
jgi:hypothetical protein